MIAFDKRTIENILIYLEENKCLFLGYKLVRNENGLNRLGKGGFSVIYEMDSASFNGRSYALKVTGFGNKTISLENFRNSLRIQNILSEESEFVVRAISSREITVFIDENNKPIEAKESDRNEWEEEENCIHLKLLLTEKLTPIILKDQLNNSYLSDVAPKNQSEVLTLALEIGQALCSAHSGSFLHRDIKLENILWDEKNKIYKISDFDFAKYVTDGEAETVIYSDGYGAPEVENGFGPYDATADIYSFGITLYLLLNELRFPGSEGYYPLGQYQYDPDFSFPAPSNSSPEFARLIRKMCSYNPADRPKSMALVLEELKIISRLKQHESAIPEELLTMSDIVTRTYIENSEDDIEDTGENKDTEVDDRQNYFERKRTERINRKKLKRLRGISISFITILFSLLIFSFNPSRKIAENWSFLLLPCFFIFEAVLLKVKELCYLGRVLCGMGIIASIVFGGFSICHIIFIICLFFGDEIIMEAGALSTILWIILTKINYPAITEFFNKRDWGWIVLLAAIAYICFYYIKDSVYGSRSPYKRILFFGSLVIFSAVVALGGLLVWILSKNDLFVLPELIDRLNLIRTGLGMLVIFGITTVSYSEYYMDDINNSSITDW